MRRSIIAILPRVMKSRQGSRAARPFATHVVATGQASPTLAPRQMRLEAFTLLMELEAGLQIIAALSSRDPVSTSLGKAL
jgi:hypothetical protein